MLWSCCDAIYCSTLWSFPLAERSRLLVQQKKSTPPYGRRIQEHPVCHITLKKEHQTGPEPPGFKTPLKMKRIRPLSRSTGIEPCGSAITTYDSSYLAIVVIMSAPPAARDSTHDERDSSSVGANELNPAAVQSSSDSFCARVVAILPASPATKDSTRDGINLFSA